MHTRRLFMKEVALGTTALSLGVTESLASAESLAPELTEPLPGEGVPGYLDRLHGGFDSTLYAQILGAANPYKEGDEIIGVAGASEASRDHARTLLANTTLAEIDHHAPYKDAQYQYIEDDRPTAPSDAPQTLGELKAFLLGNEEPAIKQLMPSLSSDVIGCAVKLMSNAELTRVGATVFNPLPGSNIGARGYLGARVQPNSPTDNTDDIRWQVFNAFAYAVGDVLLGTNPVSSTVESVTAVELCLQDILQTFELTDALPHCVLSHIDVQAEAEASSPGSTALWFQSIAGTESANGTFDLTLQKLQDHAKSRNGPYGLYFETGQGADFTNGHGHGFDMVLHESRKYGLARKLSELVAAQSSRGEAWVHLNDVAGFIGPEVFRTREQLVRCCLEDIVMGKLHGLCLGLDVCSTLHMDVSLDDLDWCLHELAPANPAYLMALPTKIDPMLGYLTTGYQDHVRLRETFNYRINEPMWAFFQGLGVLDDAGQPTEHFGDPNWVYLQYQRRRGDQRSDDAIAAEGRARMAEIRSRGLFIAEGYGDDVSDLEPGLASDIAHIYEDGKRSIWAELTPDFMQTVPDRYRVDTRSQDRLDYILHPESGEQLSLSSQRGVAQLRARHRDAFDVQLVISDGLNAHSIMDEGQLLPFLTQLRADLREAGFSPATDNILVTEGRVRTGYRIGETLFADAPDTRSILHVIGERPGTGHHTFSVYITSAPGKTWAMPDEVDHNITRVVSGIAHTALRPALAVPAVVNLLKSTV